MRSLTSDPNAWRKSSYSAENGDCVEVNMSKDAVGVRDTKDRAAGHVTFSRAGWSTLLGVARGWPLHLEESE